MGSKASSLPRVQVPNFGRLERWYTLPAYAQDGIVRPRRVYQGSTDSVCFEDLMVRLLEDIILAHRYPEQKSVMVMNTASSHHSVKIYTDVPGRRIIL